MTIWPGRADPSVLRITSVRARYKLQPFLRYALKADIETAVGFSDRNDKYTLKWLTDDGLQRLTQSRRETSSSSTDDDLGVCVLLEMGARWANKTLWYDELQKFRCGGEE